MERIEPDEWNSSINRSIADKPTRIWIATSTVWWRWHSKSNRSIQVNGNEDLINLENSHNYPKGIRRSNFQRGSIIGINDSSDGIFYFIERILKLTALTEDWRVPELFKYKYILYSNIDNWLLPIIISPKWKVISQNRRLKKKESHRDVHANSIGLVCFKNIFCVWGGERIGSIPYLLWSWTQ